MTASVAMTVSPAPVTSETSRFLAFYLKRLSIPEKASMPSSLRVRRSASIFSFSRSA